MVLRCEQLSVMGTLCDTGVEELMDGLYHDRALADA